MRSIWFGHAQSEDEQMLTNDNVAMNMVEYGSINIASRVAAVKLSIDTWVKSLPNCLRPPVFF
jgi:hypothetical protein